ncbi:MAG: MOSC N-terminal beta barrel domain-containing protein [Pseudomonadota bacterium]
MSEVLHATVEALYIYPVKACAGQRVPRLQFSEQGLIDGDREWVVVNSDAEVVWQGSHPRLALVRPLLVPGLLHLDGPEGQALTVPNPPPGGRCQVKIWNGSLQRNEAFDGKDAGDAAAAWLLQVTGAALRLVHLDATGWVRDTVNHCHIASASSMAELNATLAQQGLPCTEVQRFRPNIVITDAPDSPAALDPFVEEYCTHIRWQDADRVAQMAVLAEPCIRCIVPNVNPHTAAMDNHPLETVTRLSAERHPGKPVYFGIYAHAQQSATLEEGAQLKMVLNF